VSQDLVLGFCPIERQTERERERERERESHDTQPKGTHQGRTGWWWASNGSALALRRFPVRESGDGITSLGSGVLAKQLRSQ
jgi:hypothetical protein